jgi:hypothetical protein
MLLSDYINQVQQLVHDSAGIDYQTSELTLYINEARNRVAADFYCIRTYFTNCSTIVNQETYPLTGGIGGAKITAGGSYSSPPTVTFSAPPAGGTTATGTAVLATGGGSQPVVQIAMTSWGSGYVAAPTVTFGSGAAAATAVALLNVIDLCAISFLYPPGTQGLSRQMLLWEPFTTFNAFYRPNTVNSGSPAIWTSLVSQNQFYLCPALPDQNYVLEIDAFVYPFPLVNTTDTDAQINTPFNELVQYQAAYKALLKAQNFDQADYYDGKYQKRALQLAGSVTPPRRQNIYQNRWRRIQRGY